MTQVAVPDQDGIITVKTARQVDVTIQGGRSDFCMVVWEEDGMVRRSLSWQEIKKIRQAKGIASLPADKVLRCSGMRRGELLSQRGRAAYYKALRRVDKL